MQIIRSYQYFMLVIVAVVFYLFMSEFAHAAAPFGNGGNTLKNDIITLITPFAGIGFIVISVLCFIGKIPWGWLAATIFGIIMLFGHEQIISWIRSIFGI